MFVSMVPLIELRVAFPLALYFNLNTFVSFILCVIANMLPVPIIYLFARKVLEWGKDKRYIGKFFTWCLVKGEKAGRNYKKKLVKVYMLLCSCL